KEKKLIKTERAIAYSQYADTQVLLTVVALDEMMKTKIQAFIDRREIRDVFDIEFLYKRGIALPQEKELLQQILKNIETLPKKDYTVKLGSIISADLRKYYTQENFKILKLAIKEKLS
ncbi:MAG: nucleotidyl transferase AbiEii/AbiGii toxin family protein, partial [candidate division WOR-3 bacterium]